MSNNYKIKVGKPKVPEKVIEKHKNFDEVMTQYREITKPWYRIPLYKNPKAFLGLVMILALGWLVWEAVEEDRLANGEATVLPHEAPDLPGYQVAYFDSLAAASETPLPPPGPEAIQGKVPGVPALPLPPKVASPNAYHFNIEAPENDFPELAWTKDWAFEYAGNDPASDPARNAWAMEKVWSALSIERNAQSDGLYTLRFSAEDTSFVTFARPVVGEDQLGQAELEWKEAYGEFLVAWQKFANQGS